MDILYVGTLPPHTGGSAINAAQILEGFAAQGHTVRAIAPAVAGQESAALNGVELTTYTMPSFETSPDQPSTAKYRKTQAHEIHRIFSDVVAKAGPAIVIIGREIFVLDVAELARALGLRTVLWAQGATTWGMLSGSLPQSLTRKIVEQTRKVDRVVAVANHMLPALRELGIDKVEAIPNGVDLERFRPGPRNLERLKEMGIPFNHLVVLHVSNMKELKRPQDLVMAAEILARTNPLVTWVMVGDGPKLESVRTLCQDKGLEGKFRFTGWVNHENVPDLLRAADLVAMPSTNEGLALIYLETQASGRVLLASDIPAAREIITDGENGLLFPVADVECLARHVLNLATDPERRVQLGERARKTVQSHSMRHAVAQHLGVLEALAN